VGQPAALAARFLAAESLRLWGAEMYQTLRRSKITLNSHIDIAEREAGNMRLFEATVVSAFLLTDFKEDLHTLFEPDREVAVDRRLS
jgi:spore maturation protein CgeB